MAALSADVNCSVEGVPRLTTVKASAADIFYRGALVWVDRTSAGATVGYAQVASIAAGDRILGICTKQQAATAIGDPIEIMVGGLIWLPLGDSVTIAKGGEWLVHDIGSVQTDNPADCEAASTATLAANDALLGIILNATATMMLVRLTPGAIYSTTLGWV